MPIEFKVDHSDGRRTLKERIIGDRNWQEIPDKPELVANPDQASFYREVAAQIAALAEKGIKIFYRDSTK